MRMIDDATKIECNFDPDILGIKDANDLVDS